MTSWPLAVSAGWVALGVVGVFILVLVGRLLVLFLVSFPLWVQSRVTGAGIGFPQLVAMALRKVPAGLIVRARIMSLKGEVPVPPDRLQVQYLAGGDVSAVVRGLVRARRAGLHLTFGEAAAFDLDGGDVLQAVQAMVAAREEGVGLSFGEAASLPGRERGLEEVAGTPQSEAPQAGDQRGS